MARALALGAVGLVVVSVAAQGPPAELTRLVSRAGLTQPVAWCSAEFGAGVRPGFAVAVLSEAGGGRYLVLDADGRATALASFARNADLTCYSRTEAEQLATALSQSVAIHGSITPRWDTTVVCGFIDDTSAACWQYSPVDRSFTKVGQWVT
jgi:hypothetical protein